MEVDPADPAFDHPSKPIGPQYPRDEAERLAREHGWTVGPDNGLFRRLVPVAAARSGSSRSGPWSGCSSGGAIVICTGGGGIPTMLTRDGSLVGVEAVIDKDHAGALLARSLGAGVYLMLTDAEAVWEDWGTRRRGPSAGRPRTLWRSSDFAAGSMGPKVEAACDFARATGGRAGIGALEDAVAIMEGRAGTLVSDDFTGIDYWPSLLHQ